jgi:single-strand DNA-binding protein
MALNKVMLIGNLGKDPEVKKTDNGTSVTKLSVAITEKWKDKDGFPRENTEWVIARCWKQGAEFIGNYASKGSQVFIEGKLKTETWDAKDGSKRSQTIVEVEEIQLLGSRPNRGSGSGRVDGNGVPRRQDGRYYDYEPQPSDLPFVPSRARR